MPDEHGLQGRHAKQSYLVRMAAVGMVSQARPAQAAMDSAASLVARVIEMHVRPYRETAGSLVILVLAAGILLGFLFGSMYYGVRL